MRNKGRISTLVLLVLGLGTPGRSDQDPEAKPELLRVRYSVGDQLLTGSAIGWPCRPGKWSWISALVQNRTDEARDGQIILRVVSRTDPGEFNIRKRFELPAHADRVVQFPARFPVGSRDLPVELRLVIDGVVLDRASSKISPLGEQEYVIGVLPFDGALSFALDNRYIFRSRGPEFQPQAKLNVLSIQEDDLPDHPLAYDLFNTIVLANPDELKLLPRQWDALISWVEAGGHLVILGDAIHQHSPLDAVLPVEVIGSRQVSQLSLLESFGDPGPTHQLRLVETVPVRGRVLHYAGQNPLVANNPVGNGNVSYMAVQPDDHIVNLDAYQSMWLQLIEFCNPTAKLDLAQFEAEAAETLEEFAGFSVPGIWYSVLVLLAYLGSVVGLLFWQTQGRPSLIRWALLTAISLVVGGAAYQVGESLTPAVSDSWFNVWVSQQRSGSSQARTDSYWGLLAGSRGNRDFTIGHTSNGVVSEPWLNTTVVNGERGSESQTVSYFAEKMQLIGFHTDGYLPAFPLRATGRATEEGIQFEVSNESGEDLEAAFVLLGRRTFPMGGLTSELLQFDIGPQPGGFQPPRYHGFGQSGNQALRQQRILDQLIVDPQKLVPLRPAETVHRVARSATQSRVLVGAWSDRPAEAMSWASDGGSSGQARGRSLGLVTVTPEIEVRSRSFLIPFGGMRLQLPKASSRQRYLGGSTFSDTAPVAGELLSVNFVLPRWSVPSRIEQAWLSIDFESSAFEIFVYANDELVPLPKRPIGKYPLPRSSIAASGDALSFVIRVLPDADHPDRDSWSDHRWFVREIDVECRCRFSGNLAGEEL